MKAAFVPRLLVPILIPVLLCGAALNTAAAQQTPPPQQQREAVPSYRARVLGVYDEISGVPIEGAEVSDMVSGTSSLTTSTGTVSLVFLPDGGSIIKVRKVGYELMMLPVGISPSDTTPLTLVMQPLATGNATRLPGVTATAAAPYISPALNRFHEREKTGAAGYFINDTTLRKNEGRQLADVMRSRMLNAVFSGGPNGATYLTGSGRCPPGSYPQVFLDGVPLVGDPGPPPPPGSMRRPKLGPPNLSQFQVSDLGGVEWYPSSDTAPIDYGGTSQGCGVLLLWTRER